MAVKYNVPGDKRKKLVAEISRWLGTESKYLGAPSYAYQIGSIKIDKVGHLIPDEGTDEEMVERLHQHLYDEGFETENEVPSGMVTVSFDEESMSNDDETKLRQLIKAKEKLIRKAFDSLDVSFFHKDGKICFCWIEEERTDAEKAALESFIKALVDFSKKATRIIATEKENENDKYAMRCFLLRLGFIGDEFKQTRKEILKRLSGSSAFRNKGGNQSA